MIDVREISGISMIVKKFDMHFPYLHFEIFFKNGSVMSFKSSLSSKASDKEIEDFERVYIKLTQGFKIYLEEFALSFNLTEKNCSNCIHHNTLSPCRYLRDTTQKINGFYCGYHEELKDTEVKQKIKE